MALPLTNFERLFALLDNHKLDGVIGTSPENVTYLTGFWAMTQWVRRTPQTYAFQPARGKGNAAIATSSGLLDLVSDQHVWVDDVRRFDFFQLDRDPSAKLSAEDVAQFEMMARPVYKDPVDALVSIIKDNGLASARIGLDEVGMTPNYYDQLVATLPNATFVRAAGLLQNIRAIKTPDEIQRLRRAARIGEMSIDAALKIAAAGVTELDFLREFSTCTVKNDALPVSICIGFGDRSAMSNVQPSKRALAKGDIIRFDVGGRYAHYRSDISRIASFGEPSDKVRKYHNALHKGVLRAYELIRPGLKVADLFTAVMETVRKEGVPHYARSHVGHGIGIDGYDFPNIAPGNDAVFEENMVICVETPYYELGFAGLQVEDMIRVARDGAESLMETDGALRIIAA
jgi:Xaa-Pro dipeptidase